MQHIHLHYPAKITLGKRAIAGVVGSGDLEALFTPDDSQQLTIAITTSVDGSQLRWQHLFDRLSQQIDLPAGKLQIDDFAATPGVARLRIEQVFEEASNAN